MSRCQCASTYFRRITVANNRTLRSISAAATMLAIATPYSGRCNDRQPSADDQGVVYSTSKGNRAVEFQLDPARQECVCKLVSDGSGQGARDTNGSYQSTSGGTLSYVPGTLQASCVRFCSAAWRAPSSAPLAATRHSRIPTAVFVRCETEAC